MQMRKWGPFENETLRDAAVQGCVVGRLAAGWWQCYHIEERLSDVIGGVRSALGLKIVLDVVFIALSTFGYWMGDQIYKVEPSRLIFPQSVTMRCDGPINHSFLR